MPRRLRPQPPHLIQRDREDLALAERLARLLDGFDRGGFLGGLAPAEVERWLRRRVIFFCAMRAENLVDDDGLAGPAQKISRSGTIEMRQRWRTCQPGIRGSTTQVES